jgi:hypothetical protein
MIPIETVQLLIAGMLCFQAATLIGLAYLAAKEKRTDPRPPKAGLMSDLYRGPK